MCGSVARNQEQSTITYLMGLWHHKQTYDVHYNRFSLRWLLGAGVDQLTWVSGYSLQADLFKKLNKCLTYLLTGIVVLMLFPTSCWCLIEKKAHTFLRGRVHQNILSNTQTSCGQNKPGLPYCILHPWTYWMTPGWSQDLILEPLNYVQKPLWTPWQVLHTFCQQMVLESHVGGGVSHYHGDDVRSLGSNSAPAGSVFP